jgi:hypothetical protein
MSQAGGSADKLGNIYEGYWTVRQLIELMDEQYDTFELSKLEPSTNQTSTSQTSTSQMYPEPVGGDGHKVEFILKYADGTKSYHQVKTAGVDRWTFNRLEKEGLMTACYDKLADPQAQFFFVSNQNADDLANLSERAQDSSNSSIFQSSLSQELAKALSALLNTHWKGCTLDDAFERLRRVEVRVNDSKSLREQVNSLIRSRVIGDEDLIRITLANMAVEYIHRSVSAAQIWHELETKGFRRYAWHNDPRLNTQIETETKRFLARDEDDSQDWLERSEVEEVVNIIQDFKNKQIIILTGSAGMGKSAITHNVVQKISDLGWPTLAFRLDEFDPVRTAAELGKKLSLPESPLEVLARVAKGQHALLVIDQLDAVSQTSGRNPQFFDVVTEILKQARAYSNIRVLMACRSFDLQYDDRFQKLVHPDRGSAIKFEIEKLTKEQVKDDLIRLRVSLERYTEKQIELLTVPLNLTLFKNLKDGSRENFQSVTNLYQKFWENKEHDLCDRLGCYVRLADILYPLAQEMSKAQKLSIPPTLLDMHGIAGKALVSAGVLRKDSRSLSFFHEGFFDYCFAKQFIHDNTSLCEMLLSDTQHLFRRAQVRQVMTLLREEDYSRYISTLDMLLYDSKIRFHLKQVAYMLLSDLDEPTDDEWEVVKKALEREDKDLIKETNILFNISLGWFRILKNSGILAQIFESENRDEFSQSRIILNNVIETSPKDYLDFLEPYLNRSPAWNKRIYDTFGWIEIPTSIRFSKFFLQLIKNCDISDDSIYRYVEMIAKSQPIYACKAMKVIFDQKLELARMHPEVPLVSFSDNQYMDEDYHIEKTLKICSRTSPLAFLEEILPVLMEAASLSPSNMHGSFQRDTIWQYRMAPDNIQKLQGSLLYGCIIALRQAGSESFKIYATKLSSSRLEVAQFILLRAYKAYAEELADEVIAFLCESTERLCVGYLGQTEWASYDLLKSITPYASNTSIVNLELTLLNYTPDWERKKGCQKHRGLAQYRLLSGISEEKRSLSVNSRLKELKRKFPNEEVDKFDDSVEMLPVISPLPNKALKYMTDHQWIKAIKAYSNDRSLRIHNSNEILGGATQLAQSFQHQVSQQPERFANLILQLPKNTHFAYFENGILGLRDTELPMDLTLKIAQHCYTLKESSCKRWIPDLFCRHPDKNWPSEALEIVGYLAIKDQDPSKESLLNGNFNGDPFSVGMNSVRGSAALGIGDLLFADPKRFEFFKNILEKLVEDPALSVRSCVAKALCATLNIDREFAVTQFLILCETGDELFDIRDVQKFLHYALQSHYKILEPLLQRMCNSSIKSVAQSGAELSCLAAFSLSDAKNLAHLMIEGTEYQRLGAVEIYSFNVNNPMCQSYCIAALKNFFFDQSILVREKASYCFRFLKDPEEEIISLIVSFIGSPAFDEYPQFLLEFLNDCCLHLPTFLVDVGEKYLSAPTTDEPRLQSLRFRDSQLISEMIVRVYTQTLNRPQSDGVILNRCLNLFDELAKKREGSFFKMTTEYER